MNSGVAFMFRDPIRPVISAFLIREGIPQAVAGGAITLINEILSLRHLPSAYSMFR